ncbi:FtsX-like permease family protein [Actinoplanes sp. NPDC049265]|uniref:FtsX-like permease family protein n=1 Tax=Actinoplanes sp. NPDC049265 TaxID=3363902 RepID=UPI00371C1F4D
MTKLAVRLLRHRPGSATATLIALTFGVMILMAMGSLVDAGLRHTPTPQRYAAADIVVARTEMTFTTKEFGDTTTTRVRLPEAGTVPAALADQVRAVRGVTSATTVPSTRPGQVTAILIKAGPDADRAALSRLAATAGAATFTGSDRGTAEGTAETAATDLLVQVGASFGGYVVMLVIFVVAGLVGLSVRHRRRDLALLRAIAATPGQVRRMLVAEAALLSGVGAVLGLPLGVLATSWVSGELVHRGFVPASVPLGPSPLAAVAAAAVIALVAMLAAVVAARRATAIRPTEALGESAVEPSGPGPVRAVFGVLTLSGAFSAGGFAAGTGGITAISGAVGMLYLFVTAVALLAPWINRGAARLLEPVLRLFAGTSGYLAAANLRANARGTATVLTALVLSVGFGGSVWFLQDNMQRATVTQTHDGMLAQQAVVDPARFDQAGRLPGVTAVTPVRHTSVLVKMFDSAEPVSAQAVDPATAPATIDPGVTEGSLAAVGPDSMAVSAMQASSNSWKIGDRPQIWLADGTPVKLRVAAIYTRGLAFGDVILDTRTLAPGPPDQLLVRSDKPITAPGVVPTTDLTSQLATDMETSAWLNKLLVGVMVGYAALAAANAMVLAALARGRELAALRMAGTTRRQVGRMVNAEQAGLLGMAVVIGGVIAAVTLVAVVHALTGSFLPYIPPLGWAAVLGGATLLAMTTTILPIRRLLRTPPVQALGTRE